MHEIGELLLVDCIFCSSKWNIAITWLSSSHNDDGVDDEFAIFLKSHFNEFVAQKLFFLVRNVSF